MAGLLNQRLSVREPQPAVDGFQPTDAYKPAVVVGGKATSLTAEEFDAGSYDFNQAALKFEMLTSAFTARIAAGWRIGYLGGDYAVDKVDRTNRYRTIVVGRAAQ